MKYERLTVRTVHGEVQQLTTRADILERLAELEDKIESGEMLKLPCKEGTEVYLIEKDFDGWKHYLEWNKVPFSLEMLAQWGNYVFATEEEAEARLKEIQGE